MDNKLQLPALILIYSTIDICSSLDYPEDKKEPNRADFKKWCEQYLLCDTRIKCTTEDLYADRCGVIHSYSPESNLSKKGKAKLIVYSWGNTSTEILKDILYQTSKNVHVIHIETFFDILKQGVNKFLDDIKVNIEKQNLVNKRAKMMFVDIPSSK